MLGSNTQDGSLARCSPYIKSDMTQKISDNTGGGWAGDAYPQEEPEAEQASQDYARDYMMEPWAPPKVYK